MTTVYIHGIGIAAAGLPNWNHAREVLTQRVPYDAALKPALKTELLPPTERRRSTEIINLALHIGEQAIVSAGATAEHVKTVFASSGGDSMILHKICEALATPERFVSPTQFHNSVHNAAAGYWHIGTHSRAGSTALSSYDDSFASGLLEAMAWLEADDTPVLLAAYDVPAPPPLLAARPLVASFGVALLLSRDASRNCVASFEARLLDQTSPAPALPIAELNALRAGNPAARSLPLLHALALGQSTRVTLPYFESAALELTVRPCPN